jgi:hypothetical protein
LRVLAVTLKQLIVAALFDQLSFVKDDNLVRVSDGREPVSYGNDGPSSAQFFDGLPDELLRPGI